MCCFNKSAIIFDTELAPTVFLLELKGIEMAAIVTNIEYSLIEVRIRTNYCLQIKN